MTDETQPLSIEERALAEAVPEWGAEADGPALDDGLIRAFRAGALDEAERARVAGLLADSADDRALLRAYAASDQADSGVDPDVMSVARVMARYERPRRQRQWAAVGAVVVALAAALAVFILRPGEGPGTDAWRLDGPMGGVVLQRGEEAASSVFVPGSRFRLFVRPRAPLSGPPPTCRAMLSSPSGKTRVVASEHLTVADNGVCRLSAPAEVLFDTFGTWKVALVIGAAAERPTRRDGAWYEIEIDYRNAQE